MSELLYRWGKVPAPDDRDRDSERGGGFRFWRRFRVTKTFPTDPLLGVALDSPFPPRANAVTLLVGEREVWTGDVTDELLAFTRWCALDVATLWDCPSVVRRYLQTGDQGLHQAALHAAGPVGRGDAAPSESDARFAAQFAILTTRSGAVDTYNNARSVSHSAARAAAGSPSGNAAGHARVAAQTRHLRLLLLQRALPEHYWPLIDGIGGRAAGDDDGAIPDAATGGERVLWDVLLTLATRVPVGSGPRTPPR